MNTTDRLIVLAIAVAMMCFQLATSFAATVNTLPFDPSGRHSTYANGIDGNNIVGTYDTSTGTAAFFYDGSTLTTLTGPPRIPSDYTYATGVEGNTVVGYFDSSSTLQETPFIYNGSSYTVLPVAPNSSGIHGMGTEAWGISGNYVVGRYFEANNAMHGFVYDGSSYTTIDDPAGVGETAVLDISGTNLVGYYVDSANHFHGFEDNAGTFKDIRVPASPTSFYNTTVTGVSGNLIVGYYFALANNHGFVYDGTTFTTIDAPFGDHGTVLTGISGHTAVGYYQDGSNIYNFTVVVPEPSALALGVLGAIGGALLRRKRTVRFAAVPAVKQSRIP